MPTSVETISAAAGEPPRSTLEALRDLGKVLAAGLPIERLLTEALHVITALLRADRGAIFLGPPIRPVALVGLSVDYLEEVLIEYRRGPGGVAETQRKPLFIGDVLDPTASVGSTGWILPSARREGFRGLAIAPLTFGGRVSGGFSLYFDAPRTFARDECAIVELCADQLSLAVENAHRHDQCLEAEQLCDALLEELPIGVLVSRPGELPELANRLARSIVADSQIARALNGTTMLDKRGKEFRSAANPVQRVLAGERLDETEISIRTGHAGRATRKTYLVSSRSSRGRSITAFQDITRLREVDMFKDAVVAIAAHELRTPVLALQLSTHTLLRRLGKMEDIGPAHDVAVRLEGQVTRLAALTERFLTAASLEARLDELELSRVDVNALLQRAAAAIVAKRPGSAIQIGGPAEHVVGDPRWLLQAITELIENALTHGGGLVEVDLVPANDHLAIRVLDDGSGVPGDFIPDLFERFTLARAALPAGGLGLGLYIAAAIARRHGGELAYEPRPRGEGACFTLSLPYAGPGLS